MKQGSFDFPPNGPFSGKPTNHLTVIILTVTPIPTWTNQPQISEHFPPMLGYVTIKIHMVFIHPPSSTVTVTCSSSCSCSAKSQRFAFSTALLQAAKDTTVASYGRAGAGAGWRHGKGGSKHQKVGILGQKVPKHHPQLRHIELVSYITCEISDMICPHAISYSLKVSISLLWHRYHSCLV